MKKKAKETNPLHHLKKGDVIYRVWRPKKDPMDFSRDKLDSNPYEATPFTVESFGPKYVQLSSPRSNSVFCRKLKRSAWDDTFCTSFTASKDEAEKAVAFKNAMVNLDAAAFFLVSDMVKSNVKPEDLLELSEVLTPRVREIQKQQSKGR